MRKLSIEEIEDIKKNPNDIDWEDVAFAYSLSENFMREFQEKLNWFDISIFQFFSEEFIREFQDRIDWREISGKEMGWTENFIIEFQDKVYWPYICTYQNLSKKFCIEFYDKIHWTAFKYNNKYEYFKNLPKHVKLHIMLNYRELSKYL